MFEEAQYPAPLAPGADGEVVVELSRSHPGYADRSYRARRNAIAALAAAYVPGEHEVWRVVSHEPDIKHREYAAGAYLDGKERLGLPGERVPQLQEVSDRLEPLTGFRHLPAAGLVPLREFYGTLADSRFHSTQYIRHHTVPLHTPEPDVVHEVIGHANALANERFAALYRLAGRAARRVESAEAVVGGFWATCDDDSIAALA